ncbi:MULTISPECIES: FxSxx-COOH system tetratricopeptide repeat protein [unclassified Streptomyces]|uniref:FxSxx-COOH system tetratricopeptide repeat protein n=1 Tax=unclassified Streptomyces TaxID=2593676 RepID=UPI000CD55E10|nr:MULTISPECIES: FxSxx-COOH system tetratricopeptide repeat protein [unclassified Streptomyces]
MSETSDTAASGSRAVAIGTNQGVVSTGDAAVIDNRTIVVPLEALQPVTEVRAPKGLNNLPAPQNPVFVDRQEAMARLAPLLAVAPPAAAAVVHGLGGAGKSALALQFAHRYRDRFNPIWWIPAEDPESVTIALATLASRLSPQGSLAATHGEAAAWATDWLRAHPGWLLIFDNAGSPHDLAPVVGALPTGRHLLTSRRATGWHRMADALPLDSLPPDAAVDLLTHIVGAGTHGDAERGDYARLAAELGHLPVALEQAASYIHSRVITPGTYLERLRRHPGRVLAASGASGGRQESDSERTVARIWRLSLDAVTAEQPLAGEILRALAWYSPHEVPRELVYGFHEDPLDVDEALGVLQSYSMISLSSRAVTTHRLVQAVARTPDDDDPHRAPEAVARGRRKATAALVATLPPNPLFDHTVWDRWRELLPHARSVTALTEPDDDTEHTAALLRETSAFLQSQREPHQAVAYARRSVAALSRLRGADDRETLTARSFLASAHRDAGDLDAATPLHEELVADCERVLGADDRDTLAARSNLAHLYALNGDSARALPMQERNLADHERVLGAAHPHTLNASANLASSYRDAGDHDRAVELHERTSAEYDRVFGREHPETLTARSNLAYACQLAGDHERAVELHRSVVEDRQRILGYDHPHAEVARELLRRARDAPPG